MKLWLSGHGRSRRCRAKKLAIVPCETDPLCARIGDEKDLGQAGDEGDFVREQWGRNNCGLECEKERGALFILY